MIWNQQLNHDEYVKSDVARIKTTIAKKISSSIKVEDPSVFFPSLPSKSEFSGWKNPRNIIEDATNKEAKWVIDLSPSISWDLPHCYNTITQL